MLSFPTRVRAVRCCTATLFCAVVCVLLAAVFSACGGENGTLFERLDPEDTGIAFSNKLPLEPEFNILNYLNYYNGGGVAVGDVDNDGLQDVYFTANTGPNRLYLNKGDFTFEDVTDAAGVAGSGDWTTGATMADVNGDGLVDIYVSVVSGYRGRSGKNQLFVNNGDGTFSERAAEYGLDQESLSTHASFFDYDMDGDLDAYLVNHSDHVFDTFGPAEELRYDPHPLAGDRLYRNDGGRFVDVSEGAGIHSGVTGYGLSVVTSDLNVDGCPDIYVANDFHENDFLYYNNCDGTFSEGVRASMGHNSTSSMGADVGDVNNDGLPDLMVVDMLPADEPIRKTTALEDRMEVQQIKRRSGYYEQFSRNVLQLNRGHGRFSDVAAAAGVEATDWSWAPLFADLDLDGYQDLFVTNGIFRRPIDLDVIEVLSDPDIEASMEGGVSEIHLPIVEEMPHQPVANYAFRNEHDLTFSDEAATWGLAEPGFSTGAAYVDLDNDGDLDLVVNNIEAPASIYRNNAAERRYGSFLQVSLRGAAGNTDGMNARVIVHSNGRTLVREQIRSRGFQSSVDPRLHFGLGGAGGADSLTVVWNDGRYQTLTDVPVDTALTLDQSNASGSYPYDSVEAPRFREVAGLPDDLRHRENDYHDWKWQPLIPEKLSTEGPALAVGDVDGDGLDDLYFGGAAGQPASLLLQQDGGRFQRTASAMLEADSLYEDVDAAFFDADGDGDADLYVVSAGNEVRGQARLLADRFYVNDGAGRFRRGTVPPPYTNGSVVRPGEGRELFVGTRVSPEGYEACARNRLLVSDGRALAEVTPEALANCGFVLDAAWSDFDDDGIVDLAVVGKWMRPRIYFRRADGFKLREVGPKGWWSAVAAADINGDGADDLVLGNHGLNSSLRATEEEPVRMYAGDFDGNGETDHLLTRFVGGLEYPLAGRDDLLRAMPSFSYQFPTYAAYGESTTGDVLSSDQIASATVLESHDMASMVAVNDGTGTFALSKLPMEAQLAPMRAVVVDDFDEDGHADIVMGGNFHGVKPVRGRYDASYGAFLKGDGAGTFRAVPPRKSGLWLRGEIRALELLRGATGSRYLIAAVNDAPPQLFEIR